MPMRPYALVLRLAAGSFLLAAGGCRNFPVSLYVQPEVFEELGRTRFDPALPIEDQEDERCTTYHRVDRGVPALEIEELNEADTPLTRGLCPGDVVLARNGGAQGLGQTLALHEFTYYDHMGVLAIEEGQMIVYETWPSFKALARRQDFAAHFEGRAQRVSLASFAKRYDVLEVVRLVPPEAGHDVARVALASLEEDIRFDPYHDPERPDLSCTEYVAHLFERIGYPLALRSFPTTRNPSIARARKSLGFRCPAYLTPDAFAQLDGATPVALFSRHASLAQNLAVREACRFLHASVGPDSYLGDYLQADRFELIEFRPATRALLERACTWFGEYPTEDPEVVRARLGEWSSELFFPRPPP